MQFKSLLVIAFVLGADASPVRRSSTRQPTRNREAVIENEWIIGHIPDPISREPMPVSSFVQFGLSVDATYSLGDLKIFKTRGSKRSVEAMAQNNGNLMIEPNRVISINGVQNEAVWGLNRISHKNTTSAASENVYYFPDSAGEGVDVYVVDTGVYVDHPEFEGRAKWGASFVENGAEIDGNGHGTHVAGTIGSKTYGVAKKTTIIAVRVLDSNGSGTLAGVIEGIEWSLKASKKSGKKSVLNMSLGGGKSPNLDAAAKAAVEGGVYVVVAAGNEARSACTVSPANVPEALTVAASGEDDSFAYFSNHGACVDIIAPGMSILSTWNEPGNPTRYLDGTSMASPHAAGVMALLLAERDFESVADGFKYIKKLGNRKQIKKVPKNTVNNLLYNGHDGYPEFPDEEEEEEQTPEPEKPKCPFPRCIWDRECGGCEGMWIGK